MKMRFSWKQISVAGSKIALPLVLFFLIVLCMISIIRFSQQQNINISYRWGIEQFITAIVKNMPNLEARQGYLKQQAPWANLLDAFFQDKGKYYIVFYQKKLQTIEVVANWGTFSQENLPNFSTLQFPTQVNNSSQWKNVEQGLLYHYPINNEEGFILLTTPITSPSLSWPLIFTFLALAILAIWGFLNLAIQEGPKIGNLDRLAEAIESAERMHIELQKRWNIYEQSRQEKRQTIEHSLTETIRITNNSKQNLKDTTKQLEQISNSLGEKSQKIKSMLGSLTTMAAAIKSVASHASVSVNTSVASEVDAKKGGEVVSQIIRHMNKITQTVSKSASVIKELGESSDKIVDIINVIDDIAEQTNLLALNAAIEAARAGAQGRGFAVVSDQVRSLAEKTTHATKEISETLSSIQEKTSQAVAAMDEGIKEIDMGAGLAVQAGVSLRKIVTNAKRITEMISMIVDAAQKQAKAASVSSEDVVEIDRSMDTSCENSKETVNTAQNLEQQMQELAKWMENFRCIWEEKFLEQELATLVSTEHKEWQVILEKSSKILNDITQNSKTL